VTSDPEESRFVSAGKRFSEALRLGKAETSKSGIVGFGYSVLPVAEVRGPTPS